VVTVKCLLTTVEGFYVIPPPRQTLAAVALCLVFLSCPLLLTPFARPFLRRTPHNRLSAVFGLFKGFAAAPVSA
jgi:hypothetical protein